MSEMMTLRTNSIRLAMGLVATLALGAAAGCDDSKAAPQRADDVFAAWRNAGLTIGDHDDLDAHGLGKADCERGDVAGVETTVCAFETDEAAQAAQKAGLALVGETTGTALARGRVLLVVADRQRVDPQGKQINKVTQAFLGR
jgi:hypothetical protein